jgi:cytidyltransferase-like protein
LSDKPRMLFVDDRTRRLHAALEKYSDSYDVTLCANVKECLRLLSGQEWDVVSLDYDLSGDDFEFTDTKNTIMEVVRYIGETGWPQSKKRPRIIIHSSNVFGANLLKNALGAIGLLATLERFDYGNEKKAPIVGFVAGAFDLIHPGYIEMFRFAKEHCQSLIVALHEDPTLEGRPGKEKSVLTVKERTATLLALRYVDRVIPTGLRTSWCKFCTN